VAKIFVRLPFHRGYNDESMNGRSDVELLEEFARDRSQAAFTELVVRHRDWVRSMAMRRTRNDQLADDVTQGVFIVLASKARSIKKGTILSPWLFNVTRFVASRAMRSEARRRRHEKAAAELAARTQTGRDDPKPDEQLTQDLDKAVAALSAKDRSAILLRFYQRKSLTDVGAALAISEEAAGKRVSRAVEKLRGKLSRRGATTTAPALAAWLAQNAVHSAMTSPHGLASAAISAATGKTATGSAFVFAKGALRMMFWNKIKWIAAILLLGSLPIVAPHYLWKHANALAADQTPTPATADTTPPAPDDTAAPADQTAETKYVPTIDLTVADPHASEDFYAKLGFVHDWTQKSPDGTVNSIGIKGGITRIVFIRGQTTDQDRAARKQFQLTLLPLDLINQTNPTTLSDFRDRLTSQGIDAAEINTNSRGLPQFSIQDPDGYVINLQSMGR
jgi:RNA polymerase sigma factor (sigma-70 family)